MISDGFVLGSLNYETFVNQENDEVIWVPVLHGALCCKQSRDWYYFIAGGMKPESLVQMLRSQACTPIHENSVYILFISSKHLGIFWLNFETVKVSVETYSQLYAHNLKNMRMCKLWLLVTKYCFTNLLTWNGTKYSRMNQVKFMEDSL